MHHYFRYYGLPTTIHYSRFPMSVDGDFVFMQRFTPPQPKEEILLLHGFMEHVGMLAPFIRSLTEQGNSVSAVDFQGHGLSGGERHRVDNFREYGETLGKALEKLREADIHPRVIIGHSTGAGVAAHYILSERNLQWRKLILVAPLARSRGWQPAKLGYYAANMFVEEIPRRYHHNSSDPTYVEKQRSDPLQSGHIPLAWVRAMFEWEKRFRKLAPHSMDVDIIQGQMTKQ
ncbi:alpha/beta fold hydrolase [Salicibibacter cibi]|uniref:Alpha/beta fold hydrolase n=1 Tax=Salicibibacter cibi TaxID=2743001 RepID=A0A7T6Z9Q7_9BACI|nr:alpha/beta fold hydrolase [Salicibibacter cibi]QQK79431.1 alpha/beta fold hydrolase [Salicibibacter cibi]